MAEEMYDEPAGKKLPKQQIAIIAVVVVLIAAVYLSGAWKAPFEVTTPKIQMLIIGQPSDGLVIVLNQDNSLADYTVKSASQLDLSPEQKLEDFDLIVLDQHLGGTPYEHSVSRQLGEALQNYVRTGGKLVVIMDSGIYRSGGIYGTGVASDVVGWKATFGDIMPVECDLAQSGIPTCREQIAVSGKIHRIDFDHKIMEGIEVAPADPRYGPLSLITFNVKPTGNLVSQIKHVATASNFPGIVEKRLLIGKLLYFNYDPAVTPGIWQNTLEYLR